MIDCKQIQNDTGISCEDITKRIIDYGFHAPNLNYPNSFMIEITESENLEEICKLAECLINIKKEIDNVKYNIWDMKDNPLKNAPHTLEEITKENWDHCYTR